MSYKAALKLILVLVGLCADAETACAKAQSEQAMFSRYEQAIVKITVTGKDPERREKAPVEGSGVIIYSTRFTLVLTAAHVVGSSALTANNVLGS